MTSFLLQIVYGTIAYTYQSEIEIELNYTMNDTFMNTYGINAYQTKAIDWVQQKVFICIY